MGKRVWKYTAIAAAVLGLLIVGGLIGGAVVFGLTEMAPRLAILGAARADAAPAAVVLEIDREPEFDGDEGIVVASVAPDSPAAKAGVERGDILLEIDGTALSTCADLVGYLREAPTGEEIDLAVRHGDEERTLSVELTERNGRAYLGIVPCSSAVPRLAVFHRFAGAVITNVVPDSPADLAGLQEGDIIVSVDGQRLAYQDDLASIIREQAPGAEVTLEVHREGTDQELTVELGERDDDSGRAYLGVEFQDSPGAPFLPGDHLPFGWLQDFELDLEGLDDLELPREWLDSEDLGDAVIRGAVVTKVVDGSPAEDAGLAEGDVIVAVGGDATRGASALGDAVRAHKPGDTLSLSVIRPCPEPDEGGCEDELEIEVTLGEDPDQAGRPYLGIGVGTTIRLGRMVGRIPHRPRFQLPDLGRVLPFARRHHEGLLPLQRFRIGESGLRSF